MKTFFATALLSLELACFAAATFPDGVRVANDQPIMWEEGAVMSSYAGALHVWSPDGTPGALANIGAVNGVLYILPDTDITNAFKQITNNMTVRIQGEHTIPTSEIAFGGGGMAALDLRDRSNITFVGDGAVLRFTGSGYGWTVANLNNVRFEKLTLVGDTVASPTIGLTGAIGFDGTNDTIVFRDCVFSNWYDQCITVGPAVHVYSTHNVVVDSCKFYNVGNSNMAYLGGMPDGTCISGLIGNNWWVVNNYASNCLRFFEFENAGSSVGGVRENIHLLNNTVVSAGEYFALFADYAAMSVRNVVLRGNIFKYGSPSLGTFTGGVIGFGSATNVLVTGNIIEYSNQTALAFSLPAPGPAYIRHDGSHGCDNIKIQKNTFVDHGTGEGGWGNDLAIRLRSDLECSGYLRSVEITDNKFSGCSAGVIVAGASDIVIERNIFDRVLNVDNQAVIEFVHGTDWLGSGGRCTNLVVRGNELRSWGKPGLKAPFFIYFRSFPGGARADAWPGISSLTIEDNITRPLDLFPMNYGVGYFYGSYLSSPHTNFFFRHKGRSGSPEGVFYGNKGSIFYNANASGNAFYVKEGDGGNTGWVGK